MTLFKFEMAEENPPPWWKNPRKVFGGKRAETKTSGPRGDMQKHQYKHQGTIGSSYYIVSGYNIIFDSYILYINYYYIILYSSCFVWYYI